jgi:hypothetical protein
MGCLWSAAPETKLLQQLKGPTERTFASPLKGEHHNIASQLRTFTRKLKDKMPQLAAHLHASLKLEFPHFGYYPPKPAPGWQ